MDVPDAGWEGRPDPRRDLRAGSQHAARGHSSSSLLEDRCASGGGIYARLAGGAPYASGRRLDVHPARPAPRLGGFALTWCGTVDAGGESTLSRVRISSILTYVERNGSDFDAHTVTQSGFDIAALTAIVACSFNAAGLCRATQSADFTISRAVMTLNDFSAPIVSSASGDLLSAATLRGPASVSFAAKDSGGGVYRVVVTADGKDVGSARRAGLVRALRVTSIPPTRTRSSGRSRARSRSGRR